MGEYRSPLADVPLRDLSITERLFEGLGLAGDRVVLTDGPSGDSSTGSAMIDRIRRLAGGLQAQGVGTGSVLALRAPNMPDYAVFFHAAALTGATVTTINPAYTAPEVSHQLHDSGSVLLATIPAFLPVASAAAEGSLVREIVTLGESAGYRSLDDLMSPPLAAQVTVDLDGHVLALPYSSARPGCRRV